MSMLLLLYGIIMNSFALLFISYISCYFTNIFCLREVQEIAKREGPIQVQFVVLFHVFWYECSNISCLCSAFIRVLKFVS